MTEVFFTENSDGMITGFRCTGHAGYKRFGPDMVCAGISALTINANNSLEEIAGASVDTRPGRNKGDLSVRLLTKPDEKTEVIMRSLVLGLREISRDYGEKYCKVTIKEEVQC